MRTKALSLCCAVALIATTSACASGAKTMGVDTSWGEANRQTMAAQVIDPAPQYATSEAEVSGEKAAAAIERYRTDKIKQPEKLTTPHASGK